MADLYIQARVIPFICVISGQLEPVTPITVSMCIRNYQKRRPALVAWFVDINKRQHRDGHVILRRNSLCERVSGGQGLMLE